MLGLMFIKNDRNDIKPIKSNNNKIRFYDNMYDKSFKGKIKEFLFLNLKFVLVIYKVILSIIR